jgi:hypothetical protein
LETNAVNIFRLRIHDILLWSSRGSQREQTAQAGREILRRSP